MKTMLLYLVLQLGSTGADAYYTDRNFAGFRCPRGYQCWTTESDPIAKPFVGARKGVIVYFSVDTAVKSVAVGLLRRRRRMRTAAAVAAWGIGDSVYGAVSSAQGH